MLGRVLGSLTALAFFWHPDRLCGSRDLRAGFGPVPTIIVIVMGMIYFEVTLSMFGNPALKQMDRMAPAT